ncbi:phosphoglucosamine mutase [bacterium]|nr:phosphoglucosamine mutase [bacterium]MCG2676632.1 phosphoglucosamine mutase [bacterium]
MRRLFGTDGIRGRANVYPMTPEIAFRLGKTVALFFKKDKRRASLAIGRDTRLSGPIFEEALASGISSVGGDVLKLGILPTPAIAYLTKSLRADAGIVISASHNPYYDNGIKFFSRRGLKLSDDYEKKIEERLLKKREVFHPTGKGIGRIYSVNDASRRYEEFALKSFPRGLNLRGYKIVIDCANGATYQVAPQILRTLDAELITLNVSPDGTNINRNCGSLSPEVIQERVLKEKADVGISFDGDGDRVIFMDEKGEVVDGDQMMALCAQELIKKKRLPKKTLVATVMSNLGLDLALEKMGGKVIRTPVGDRYVLDEMLKKNLTLGGEQSGHIIFLEHNTTGDGIITALQILSIMKKRSKPLSELAQIMEKLPQVLVNVRIKKKKDPLKVLEIKKDIERAGEKLGSGGRILVRPSGTEPLIRVMIEGKEKKEIETIARNISKIIKRKLG